MTIYSKATHNSNFKNRGQDKSLSLLYNSTTQIHLKFSKLNVPSRN